jgi:hypothetical protein
MLQLGLESPDKLSIQVSFNLKACLSGKIPHLPGPHAPRQSKSIKLVSVPLTGSQSAFRRQLFTLTILEKCVNFGQGFGCELSAFSLHKRLSSLGVEFAILGCP